MLAIKNIEKSYGRYKALDDVSLQIERSEFVSLLGPSGSGKTTLLMVLAGFVRANSGSLVADGREMLTEPPHRRGIGMVFQSYALFPHMSVLDNVAYPLKLRGMPKRLRHEKAAEMLATMKLEGVEHRSINQLSGGQRQRVALARALVFEPKILLMDEPLSALDKQLREHMQVEIRRLHEKFGTTTIYVTHDQQEALTMSDRIAVMKGGTLVQVGPPGEVYSRPKNAFVAEFFGDTNMLPVEMVGRSARYGGLHVPLSACDQIAGHQAWMVLRSERLRLLDVSEPDFVCFDGTLKGSLYQGDGHVLYVETGEGHEVRIKSSRGDGLALGSRVVVGIRREDLIFVSDQ